MEIITGTSANLSRALMEEMGRYRHRVFVEKLGWELNSPGGMEVDQFDREDTVYVLARNEEGQISGTARLLPTVRPYLMSEVFPHMLNGLPPPQSPDIWELSRFASVDFSISGANAMSQFSAPATEELFIHAIIRAAELGAKQLLSLSSIGVERIWRRSGIEYYRAGPPEMIAGYPVTACYINTQLHGKALAKLHYYLGGASLH